MKYNKEREESGDCNHGIHFDLQEAEMLLYYQVRERFPRLNGLCPLGCGYTGIYYASKGHYIFGDW